MKKEIMFVFLVIFSIGIVSAVPNLEIEKVSMGDVVVAELDNPAIFNFIINNKGAADSFEIYSLVGVSMAPKGMFDLSSGKNEITVSAYPSKELRRREGLLSFQYEIKGQNSGIFKDKLTINIVPLKNVVSIKPGNIKPGDENAEINVTNMQNTNIENMKISFKSVFYEFSEVVSLSPFESKSFEVKLDVEKIGKLVAGPYVVSSEVSLQDVKTKIESVVNYLEKEGLSIKDEKSGFIIRKRTIEKKNEGNVNSVAKIEMKKDILTRLLTTYSVSPSDSNRQGVFVSYVWEKSLAPGESFSVTSTSNFTFPFILVILVVLIIFLIVVYSRKTLALKKRVSFVKTKGGELALKVTIHLRAKGSVENVNVVDRVPHMTKLYEGFGRKPDRVDEKARTLHWNVGNLRSGEERIFSYIIYSKLRVVGKLELPVASASYQKDGERKLETSNKTYFLSDVTTSRD